MSENNDEFYANIMEAIEHLEKSLLDYDEILLKKLNDSTQIHIIFRNAHNLKGILAFAKLVNSQNLIHIVEDTFDQIRNGKLSASTDLIDKSLKALDLISKTISKGIEDPNDFAELKQSLVIGSKIVKTLSALPFQLFSREKDIAIRSCKRAGSFFVIEKLIKTSIDKESYSNLPIFGDVAGIGTLIGFRPEWGKLNKKSEDDVIRIFFSTEKNEEDLFFIIFDPVKLLNKDRICKDLYSFGGINQEKYQSNEKVDDQSPLPASLKILIVEDDFITRTLESNILTKYGQCKIAVNGKEAITEFRNSLREKKPYNLILIDIMIPDIDGEAVLSKIRSLETRLGVTGLDRVKIIMVSSINTIETIKHCFLVQSDAYLIKPFTEKKLIKEFQHLNFNK